MVHHIVLRFPFTWTEIGMRAFRAAGRPAVSTVLNSLVKAYGRFDGATSLNND